MQPVIGVSFVLIPLVELEIQKLVIKLKTRIQKQYTQSSENSVNYCIFFLLSKSNT